MYIAPQRRSRASVCPVGIPLAGIEPREVFDGTSDVPCLTAGRRRMARRSQPRQPDRARTRASGPERTMIVEWFFLVVGVIAFAIGLTVFALVRRARRAREHPSADEKRAA